MKAVHAISIAITNEEIGGDTEHHLSHNSHKHQNKIDAQATEIATVKAKLIKALQENKKLKNWFNPDKMVDAMSKAVSTMILKEHPKHCRALSIKVPPVMWAGSNSPIQRTTVSGLIIKSCMSCRFKSRWQLPRLHQKRVMGLTCQNK